MSVAPPAGQGTQSVIGRDGKAASAGVGWAKALVPQVLPSAHAAVPRSQRRRAGSVRVVATR